MSRIPWGILFALLAGLGLGLAYSWVISPKRVTNAAPAALRADFKDHYRAAIAAAYAANRNLPRAQARLTLLADADPVQALNAQAQRMLASGASSESRQAADRVAALASALEGGIALEMTPTAAAQVADSIVITATPTVDLADLFPEVTGSPQPADFQPTADASTPRPTRTPVPTRGAPFALSGQETVCDPNLPEGLLQIIVFDSRRRQLAGAEILIAWDGGEEAFFTGLKPERGNGYADFVMARNTAYTVQLAAGSDIAAGLTASTCRSADGDTFLGGIRLTFQQP